MGMADCEADKARVEIDKLVSINILYNASLTRVGGERIEPNKRGRDQSIVLFQQGSGFWAWRSNHDLRIFRGWHRWRRAHFLPPIKIAQVVRCVPGLGSLDYC